MKTIQITHSFETPRSPFACTTERLKDSLEQLAAFQNVKSETECDVAEITRGSSVGICFTLLIRKVFADDW